MAEKINRMYNKVDIFWDNHPLYYILPFLMAIIPMIFFNALRTNELHISWLFFAYGLIALLMKYLLDFILASIIGILMFTQKILSIRHVRILHEGI